MPPGGASPVRPDRPGALPVAPDPDGDTHEAAAHRTQGRLETVGLLAGGVAHDFNNALTAILGYSDLMMQRMDTGHDLRRYAEEISRAAASAARLTRQLVMFSKREGGEPRVLCLNQMIEGLARMLRRLIGEDLELETGLDPSLSRTCVDEGEIEQVVVNLALGIRRILPQGGRLRIETSNVVVGSRRDPILRDLRPGAYVRLSLTGQGDGLRETGRGIESGVFGVTRLVGRAGGSVEVDPVSRDRTAFRVYLPAVPCGGGEVSTTDGVGGQPGPSRETILVVEDDPSVRVLVRKILAARGYNVLVAACGKDALETVESYDGRIDLLLSDIVMPGLPGPETARRIRDRRPGLKVLFMSGYADETLARHGLREDTIGFIGKPFSPGALAEKVRKLLAD